MQIRRTTLRGGSALALAVALTIPTMLTSTSSAITTRSHGSTLRVLPGSRVRGTRTDPALGSYHAARMGVEVVLRPRHAAAMQQRLHATYQKKSGSYRKFLKPGQFTRRYAPTAATRRSVARYLRSEGLTVHRGTSPFLVRASGPSTRVAGAFHTQLKTYRSLNRPTVGNSRVTRYFANARSVRLPASMSRHVLSVIGLTNTVRMRRASVADPTRPMGHHSGGATQPACEAPYPTAQQFYDAVNLGTGIPFGYGGSPDCNGLTPTQVRGIYKAPTAAHSLGRGATIGLFELSGYQQSDIATYGHQFYGNGYTPPLQDVTVDGGPLSPVCPVGDQCPPEFEGYSGDVEVAADIEASLAVAPNLKTLQVYNAPNDFTGQTEIDEYTKIAQDDTSSSISSSWGLCEQDAGADYAQAENLIFEQMALQGQSLFVASGDTGAFDCIRGDGTTVVNVGDPASQPWVTSVGGTSLSSYNPGGTANPSYPAAGESVWNVDNLCNASTGSEGGQPGSFWCAATGAGGGGSSQFWGRPFYQVGQGVNSPLSVRGNGTTQCALARVGTPCREVPDVSADADAYTPYAEYCTGSAATPFSACATFGLDPNAPGWFGIGGTSLSSPVWSAVIGDRNGYWGRRTGNANVFFYLHNLLLGGLDFHDVTGAGQVAKNNGVFPTTKGYDMATGLGTPKMNNIIQVP